MKRADYLSWDEYFMGVALLAVVGGLSVNTDLQVLDDEKKPIEGLYAAGNTCGQRYAIQYHTPTSGNSCGSALTTGYIVPEYISRDLKG